MGEHRLSANRESGKVFDKPELFRSMLRFMRSEPPPTPEFIGFDDKVARMICAEAQGDYTAQQIIAKALHLMNEGGWLDDLDVEKINVGFEIN